MEHNIYNRLHFLYNFSYQKCIYYFAKVFFLSSILYDFYHCLRAMKSYVFSVLNTIKNFVFSISIVGVLIFYFQSERHFRRMKRE